MAFLIGDVVSTAGRTVTGTLTLTPASGAPVVVRVRAGLIHPTPVPDGTYTVTGAVRGRGDTADTAVPARDVTVAGPRYDLSLVVPGPGRTAPAAPGGVVGELSIVEVQPGVYQVTGATVNETQPGTYTLSV